MQLIVGLGNPGPTYQATRHNIGFMAVEAIAHRHNFSDPQEKFSGLLREGRIGGRKIRLFQPMTFMNRSGIPLSEMARFYKILPEEVTVLYDELDLPLGKIRVKQGGGNNGHNGLKSIDAHFGIPYTRVRMGIDRPQRGSVSNYVLGNFTPDDVPVVGAQCDAIADHIEWLLNGNAPEFMNKVALAMQPLLQEK
ncbi:MAG: aminoacyl-tRNA hydrolase [Alphaproteobacteria bacterium]|nr:aminoacyl-tRNA hydrolase [Alphaproteobacteria bacterium]